MSLDDIAPGPALPPLTPREVLLEEFMRPLELSSRGLAAELGVPGNRISSIVAGTRAVTPETAILLARRFATRPSDDPDLGQRRRFAGVGSLDDFHVDLAANALQSLLKLYPLIAAISL